MATDPREYFPAITNYIPSLDDIQNSALTLKSTVVDIVKGRANNSGLAVHTVTFMKFEEWTCHNQTHYYLIIGTSTGFQVFLLHDARDREQKLPPQQSSATNLNAATQITSPSPNASSTANASPLLNPLAPLLNASPHHSPSLGAASAKRKKFHKKALLASDNLEIIKVAPGGGKQQRQINNPISCAAIVQEPHKWEGPIIAVSPANEAHNFDSKCVRLYSLMEQQYVHVYRLRTRVHGIFSRSSALIIVTEKEIVVMNPMTDEKLYRKTCAPNPVNGVVASLGARWLAFADTKLRQTQIGTHMLPRNKNCGANNNYTSTPKQSPLLKKQHKKKKTIKKTKKEEETMNDEIKTKKQNIHEDDDEFGALHTNLEESWSQQRDGRRTSYDLMTSQLYNASDQITKTVSNTMSGTMKFIQESFVETRKEVQNAVKKQQENILRKRNELRQRNADSNVNDVDSNLYCDDAPCQGIISIIDYISGDLLQNFMAHPNAPLMHIAFDDSGTLLVSADRDGIYLNVFQVIGYPQASLLVSTHDDILQQVEDDPHPNQNNTQQPTVYRHLYRIYRGFRYAIIRDITFSTDSKWMAVSSARGTIHIYAINREGGVPMYSTHNMEYHDNIQLNDALCIDMHKMYDLQSLKKVHHEMKETRKDQMGNTTTSGGTKIVSTFSSLGQAAKGTLSLFVQTPIAFHQYTIHTMMNDADGRRRRKSALAEEEKINNENEKELFLDIEHLHKFSSRELYHAQSVSYPYLHDQLYPESAGASSNIVNPLYNMPSSITMSVFNLDLDANNEQKSSANNETFSSLSSSTNKKYDEDTKRWLANTELHPINRFNEVSLWGNPQFNFYSFSNSKEAKEEEKEEKKQEEEEEQVADIEPMSRKTSNLSSESLASMKTVDITPEPKEISTIMENDAAAESVSDPYSFLDRKRIENAIPIKLHEDSPSIGPRGGNNQPQIEVNYNAISDLQGTIDTAIGTVIESENKSQNKESNDNSLDANDNDDNYNTPPAPPTPLGLKSIQPEDGDNDENSNANNSDKNGAAAAADNILPLILNEQYAKKLDDDDENDEQSDSDDDFQIVD